MDIEDYAEKEEVDIASQLGSWADLGENLRVGIGCLKGIGRAVVADFQDIRIGFADVDFDFVDDQKGKFVDLMSSLDQKEEDMFVHLQEIAGGVSQS